MSEWKKISLHRKIIPVLSLILIFFACQEAPQNNPPVISDLIVYPSIPKAGQLVLLTGIAEDEDGDAITYKWIASGGTFLDSLGANPIQWQAPSESDTINLFLHVSDHEATTIKMHRFYLEAGLGIVAGHVTDFSTGYLLSNVTVKINDTQIITGSDGYFNFPEVVAGDNIPISASANNYVTYANLINVKVEENIVNIPMTLLTEVGRIAGYITDIVTGEKLAGVIVQTGTIADTTKTDGYYELYNVPISENVPVRASLAGYSIHSGLINVVAGYNTNNIDLEPNIATVSGRISTESDGTLLSGVVVTINQYQDTTNAAGYFELQDIPVSNNASVSAVLDGYITSHIVVDIVGGVNNIDIELSGNPGALSGWIRSSLDGSVLPNITVQVDNITVTTTYDGSYQVNGLNPGTTLISCSASGYDTFTDLIEIQAGSNNLDINMVPIVGNVTGFLRDSLQGISIAEQTIQLGSVLTTTGLDGAFEFENIPVGQHLLSVNLVDYQEYSHILEVVAGINVKNILLIPSTGMVVGIVKDALTDSVLPGATVNIGEASANTDVNGYFELPSIALGTVQITCQLNEFMLYQDLMNIEVGNNVHNISLTSAVSTVLGTVTSSSSTAPLAGVLVTVGGLTDTTDTNGLFNIVGLEPGTLQIIAQLDSFVTYTNFITITAGENIMGVELVANYGTLKGFVTDSVTESLLDSVTVILSADTLMTGIGGYYEFPAKPVGEQLSLQVRKTGYVSYAQWIELGPGDNVMDVSLAPQ